MSPGVFQSIFLASVPTATTFLVPRSMATTEGSQSTIPLPRACTRVLHVPRSIPRSVENASNILSQAIRDPFLSLAAVAPRYRFRGTPRIRRVIVSPP